MYRIIILDGDASFAEQVQALCRTVLDGQNAEYHIGCLPKADYQQSLTQLLTEDLQHCGKGEHFVFVNGSTCTRAALAQITHMEIFGRKVVVYLPQQRLMQDGKLADLLEALPGNSFVRCHQGYAVNLRHVRELRHRELLLDNGLTLPVSRTFYKSMKQAFVAWNSK